MAVTADSFKAKFPEFACLDDAVINRWLTEASSYVNATQWGAKADDGICYLTAHLLTVFESEDLGIGETGAGPVTAEKEGQVSVSISPLVVAEAFRKDSMGATKYGRRYIDIRALCFACRCL